MKRFIPKVGQTFKSRKALSEKLEQRGWEFKGCETYYHSRTRRIIGYNLDMESTPRGGSSLLVELDPTPKGVRVTAVTLSGPEGKRKVKPVEYFPIRGLDPEIKNLVRELNESGYTTTFSCAGHGERKGFINFSRADFTRDESEAIRDIFRQEGVRRVTLRTVGDFTRATFPGIG